jgi:hypothetical protein
MAAMGQHPFIRAWRGGGRSAAKRPGVADTNPEPAGGVPWREIEAARGGGGCQVGPWHSDGRRGLKLI